MPSQSDLVRRGIDAISAWWVNPFGRANSRIGAAVARQIGRLEREALLRPLGNVVYFIPPYVITPDEIDRRVATAREGIEAVTCD